MVDKGKGKAVSIWLRVRNIFLSRVGGIVIFREIKGGIVRMKYFGQDELHILAECYDCGRVLKMKRVNLTANEFGFNINPNPKCPCGRACLTIEGSPPYKYTPTIVSTKDIQLKCPKCKSTNLTANNKGFGLGKAAVGGILLGPVGLLGGLFGSKKPVFICLNCGNQFEK